jgi:hypothetical protein
MRQVLVALAKSVPASSVSLASAEATRDPKEITRPSARSRPVRAVGALWKMTLISSVV